MHSVHQCGFDGSAVGCLLQHTRLFAFSLRRFFACTRFEPCLSIARPFSLLATFACHLDVTRSSRGIRFVMLVSCLFIKPFLHVFTVSCMTAHAGSCLHGVVPLLAFAPTQSCMPSDARLIFFPCLTSHTYCITCYHDSLSIVADNSASLSRDTVSRKTRTRCFLPTESSSPQTCIQMVRRDIHRHVGNARCKKQMQRTLLACFARIFNALN